ncbi:uncharacterized protein LOC110689093 [Chenopodium quinoa]|uniref:uncharacterized protein LOC110689093 n=1 Tax=Chenopodium quinoa TaxID=63459 RepID=UPI000B772AB2|nr:uncharacterized protein LOC110689093 [Chenopodium quinoa]
MTVSDKKFNEMMTHNKMLETQTEQANTLKDCASPSSLPSQGVEPKKPVYSITTRSGRVLDEGVSRSIEEDKVMSDLREENEKGVSKSVSYEEVQEKKKNVEKEHEEVRIPDLPYPQKFLRHKMDEQFKKFLDMLKEVHLSIPFTDAITQMPRYSKFLKEILDGERECNEVDSVEVGKCFSALIHKELPEKMEDPGNISIPCKIKEMMFDNALCDLGASVSITPYSIFKKLKLGKLLQSNITLQLADRSIKFPKGRVEDVPLKIGELTIPVDFIVLEIAEDDHIPIILGRPFLATSGALIDVKGGRITLRVDENVDDFDEFGVKICGKLMKIDDEEEGLRAVMGDEGDGGRCK